MKSKLLYLPLLLVTITTFLQSCDDEETYADKRKRENRQIDTFLQTGAQVKSSDGNTYVFNFPGNIQVISEDEFYQNDSTTDVSKNQYVLFSSTGVYMQIVEKGSGSKLADGETTNIITRYTEFNISTDSIQSTNRISSYEMQPDIMTCSNTLGVFSASFRSGVMVSQYNTSAVPNGWLIPLTYINLGRLDTPDAKLAHVRLIVPSAQGQSDAANNIYPCAYDITYQRVR